MNNVTTRLIDQMEIKQDEIVRRLHLLDFTYEDVDRIKAAQPDILPILPDLLNEFYDTQIADPEIAAIIGDSETLARLTAALKGYITRLFDGCYDDEYVNSRLRIGKVHRQLGVSPRIYMRGQVRLQALLDAWIDRKYFVEDAKSLKKSLHKLLLFDARFIFDAYIESYITQMENASREVETYAAQIGMNMNGLSNRLQDSFYRDGLTGLYGRHAFQEFLTHESKVSQRHNLPFVLLYIDLNGFKEVNDQHGHSAGDEVLACVGAALQSATRSLDIPSRFGGDEFCILMPRITVAEISAPRKRIIAEFENRCAYPVTFSVGIVQSGPEQFADPTKLLVEADRMMYVAKGRARQDPSHHWEIGQVGKDGLMAVAERA